MDRWKRYLCVKVFLYFLEPHTHSKEIRVGLGLFNYSTNSDLKNATGVDASSFSKKN